MPATVVIPNSYGIATFRWTFIPAGKQLTVTMGFQDTTFSNNAALAASYMYGPFVAASRPANAANMSTNWRFEGVTTLMRTTGGILIAGADLIPVTGTATGTANQNPIFTTLVISKLTANAGRPYRGRMYAPFVDSDESAVDFNGTINPSIVALHQARWDGWLATVIAGGSFYPEVLHSSTSPATSPTPIVSLKVRPVVGIQRRRRARGA